MFAYFSTVDTHPKICTCVLLRIPKPTYVQTQCAYLLSKEFVFPRGELAKKRSKLVLPAPQISDLELEEVRTYVFKFVYTYVCMYVRMCVPTYVCVRMCVSMYIICAYVCKYVHTLIYVYSGTVH